MTKSATLDEQPLTSYKVYFPGLNALRFFAAILVLVSHTEYMKDFWHLPNYHSQSRIANIAALSVTFFFTLSGFLITYLLFIEKEKNKTIDIKRFYLRRALRIWPLYYIIVLLSFFIIPFIPGLSIPFGATKQQWPVIFTLYILILPNVVHLFKIGIPYATQLWSIGVEEQFYLVWPWLIRENKKYFILLITIISIFFLARNGCAYAARYQESSRFFQLANSFLISLRFGCMAIGGLYALLLYQQTKWLNKALINRFAELISFILFTTLAYYNTYIPYAHHEFYAILFGIFIINISQNKHSLFRLENRLWTELGNISYGIYMYHLLGIGIALILIRKANLDLTNNFINALLHILSLIFTVSISYISYRHFESYFIRIKHKFTKIKSGSMG